MPEEKNTPTTEQISTTVTPAITEVAVIEPTIQAPLTQASDAQPAIAALDAVTEEQEIVTGTTNVEAIVEPETFVIDDALVAVLFTMLTAATRSKFYMSGPRRVKVLKEALAIPVSDDKSFTMFHINSEKDLITEAYREARKIGATPTDVTNVQVIAEAQRRYVAKHGVMAPINEEYIV
jgi:hypothetical protein